MFDLDGVLVDSTGVVERGWRRWALEAGIAAADVLAVAHGRPSREVIAQFAPHLDATEEANRLEEGEIEDPEGVAVLPGASECVALATQARWAVVTSAGTQLARSRMEAVGLPLPPVLITADDVTRGKPDPEPYERASRSLGVHAADCLVIEDAPSGIAAARAAGMTVVAVATTYGAEALRDAGAVLPSMCDVYECLRAHPVEGAQGVP